MSETIATRTVATVSPVSCLPRVRAAAPVLLAMVTAELAARLVTPRAPAFKPVAVDTEAYFSAEDIERGARFARAQLALGLPPSAKDRCALAGRAIARS